MDFADSYVGGLALFGDHVAQEELIFAIRPELLVMLLFVTKLRSDEAVVVKGAESFVLNSGERKKRSGVRMLTSCLLHLTPACSSQRGPYYLQLSKACLL